MTPSWRYLARCEGQHINTMFPEERNRVGSVEYLADVADLRERFCWRCPVRSSCLVDGMQEEGGIWGGLDVVERRMVTQLACYCGRLIDPKAMNSPTGRHFCPECRPSVLLG